MVNPGRLALDDGPLASCRLVLQPWGAPGRRAHSRSNAGERCLAWRSGGYGGCDANTTSWQNVGNGARDEPGSGWLTMRDVLAAVGLGAASGVLGVLAYRFRWAWLGWLTLAPLATAVYLYSPLLAGLAGGVCGLLLAASNRQTSRPAVYRGASAVIHLAGISGEALFAVAVTLLWAGVFALAAWLWPNGVPAWGALIMPAAAVAVSLYDRVGAPRYQSWFLGTQDGVLLVVHIARAGPTLVIPALLALSAAVPVTLLAQRPPSAAAIGAAAAAAVVIAAALAFGRASYRRAIARAGRGQLLRVAAVSASPAAFDPLHVPGYSDVDATITRYQPHIAAAIAHGARLIVLPEYAVVVSAGNRHQWLAALSQWARQARAPVVSGVIEPDRDKNQLVIADQTGAIAVTHDKQHPAPFLEPRPDTRTPPALLPHTPAALCAVQCVDLDYPDLVRPVGRAGGVLAVPADDWKEITGMHHRSAVWSAVMAGVPVVRSNGHGISAVYDAAGRVVATANSLDGPVVLVADVRAAQPGKAASQALSAAA